MTIGVRYAPHEGPPRDVTIRCEVWIAIEADGYEGDDPASTADPVGFVEWREVFEAAYSLEGVSRLDRAAVDSVEWENPCRVVVSLTLDITLLGEDESLSTLAQRFSSDWEIHNDSFDLPEPWQAFVGGRCKALMPEVGPDADQGGGRSGDAGVSDGPVRSQDVLNYRTYAAFRRGIGDPAFWLEGIAALGRSRAASLRGVGKTALEEVDAALATHGMRWADPSEPIPSQGRPLPGDALSGQGNGRGSLDSEVLGPGRALVSRIVKAADDGRDDEVEELLAAFDETIAELLPEGDLRAEMLVDRVVRGRTLDEIGVRFNITRERVR